MKLKLVEGEQVIIRTRAHHRALVPALVNFLLAVLLVSFLLGYIARGDQPEFVHHYSHIGSSLVWLIGGLVIAFGSVKPLLAWLNRYTYLTNLRVVQKNIVGATQPVVVPLGLLTEIRLKRGRGQGAGRAGDVILIHGPYGRQQRTVLKDMPDVEQFHSVLAEELGTYRRQAAAQYAQQQYQSRGAVNPPYGGEHYAG